MKNYKICVIKGDGIGPEIIDEAIKVLDVLSLVHYSSGRIVGWYLLLLPGHSWRWRLARMFLLEPARHCLCARLVPSSFFLCAALMVWGSLAL